MRTPFRETGFHSRHPGQSYTDPLYTSLRTREYRPQARQFICLRWSGHSRGYVDRRYSERPENGPHTEVVSPAAFYGVIPRNKTSLTAMNYCIIDSPYERPIDISLFTEMTKTHVLNKDQKSLIS
jgi:hypothetical protein